MQKFHYSLATAALILCLGAGCSSSDIQTDTSAQPQSSTEAEQPEVTTQTIEEPTADPFGDAVREATTASNLVQEANRPEAWETVIATWEKAIDHLSSVPEGDENYAIAQQKIEEYQANLDYAEQNLLTATFGEALVNTGSTAGDIQTLIDQGADPRAVKTSILGDPTPQIYYAASFGSDAAVKVLLENGATWDQMTSEQLDDALISASCSGFLFTVQELLKAGANPNATNHHSEKPLMLSQSEVCQSVDMTGPIPAGSRQHAQVEAALRSAGAQ